MSRILIGVYVCKDFLDACARPAGAKRRFGNTPEGIEQLVAWVQSLAPERVVFESTGPYQKAAVGALLAAGLPAVVVNARQVRDFAKGTGQLAKTDAIDAAVLAHFGEVVATVVRPCPPRKSSNSATCAIAAANSSACSPPRRTTAMPPSAHSPKVQKNIDKHVAFLERQIEDLEGRLDRLVADSETFKAKDAILQSIVGVGPQSRAPFWFTSRTRTGQPPIHRRPRRPGPVRRRQRPPAASATSAAVAQGPHRAYQAAVAAIRYCRP